MLAGSNISITGAASSVVRDDLPINKVAISDSAGKKHRHQMSELTMSYHLISQI